jgi:hypothetical protein
MILKLSFAVLKTYQTRKGSYRAATLCSKGSEKAAKAAFIN